MSNAEALTGADGFYQPLSGRELRITEFVDYVNPYRSAAAARTQIRKEFAAQDQVPGGMVVQLVNLRAGLVAGAPLSWHYRLPQGVAGSASVAPANSGDPEILKARVEALIRAIAQQNELRGEAVYLNQVQAEQEGSLLVSADYEIDAEARATGGVRVKLRPRLRSLRQYEIIPADRRLLPEDKDPEDGDPLAIRGCRFLRDESRGYQKDQFLAYERFEYVRLGGSRDDFDPPPPLATILALVKLYEDIPIQKRANLSFFAKTILAAQLDGDSRAAFVERVLRRVVKSFRAIFGFKGKLYFVEPSGSAAEALAQEQDYLIQEIWGRAGIPAIYSGMLRLAKNQATPRETKSVLQMTFGPLRNRNRLWFYPRLMRKAIEALLRGHIARINPEAAQDLYDEAGRVRPDRREAFESFRENALEALGIAGYEPENIECEQPPITEEEVRALQENLTEHRANDAISLETYVRRAPDLPEDEAERIRAEKQANAAAFGLDFDDGRTGRPGDDDHDGEGQEAAA